MKKNYDYILKFVIVGSSSVGKSSILRRFANNQFEQTYVTTIGIDFRFKSLDIDGNFVKLQLWDTAGQQRFRGVTKSYYKGAHAIILVYDVMDQKSFEDVVGYWVKETKQYSPEDRIFCFINKCDQGEDTQVSPEQLAFLQESKIRCFKVSAKSNFNVLEGVIEIARQIMKKQPKVVSTQGTPSLGLSQSHRVQSKKKCCSL